MIVLNEFSANMLAELPASVTFEELTAESARAHLMLAMIAAEAEGEVDIPSAVGHKDTAEVFSTVLGLPVPCERRTVTLRPGDRAILGLYSGPRLPKGAYTFPEGGKIKWMVLWVS